MLTVASPKADDIEIAARANSVESAIRKARDASQPNQRVSASQSWIPFPNRFRLARFSTPGTCFKRKRRAPESFETRKSYREADSSGFDGLSGADDGSIQAFIKRFISERLKRSELHPDAWEPVIIRDPAETRAKLAAVAGDKYSYAELDNFSDLIGRTVAGSSRSFQGGTAGRSAADHLSGLFAGSPHGLWTASC